MTWKEFMKPSIAKIVITVALFIYFQTAWLLVTLDMWSGGLIRGLLPVCDFHNPATRGGCAFIIGFDFFVNVILFYLIACIGLFLLRKVKRIRASNFA